MDTVPYPPSWQNRFFAWLGRGPLPAWAKSVLFFLALTLVNHLVPWFVGAHPMGRIDPYQLNFQIWFLVVFWAGEYFLRYSRTALLRFRPAFDKDDEAYAALRYRFEHLSSRTGWILTGLGGLFSLYAVRLGAGYQQAGPAAIILILSGVLMFSLVFFLFAYLLRALILVRRLYREVGHINLFHLAPLHAFAGFSSRVGGFFVVTGTLSYFTNITLSRQPQLGSFAFFVGLNTLLAGASFILPLGGIHERLRQEKERLAAQNDARLEVALRQLHERFDRAESAGMTEFRHSISAMLDFRNEIRSVSTWPWEPGTLRGFVSAMLLPVALFLLQRFLGNLFSL